MTGMEPALVASIASAASTGLSIAQSRQQARAQSRALSDQARARLEELQRQRDISQRETRDKLRRDLASQRARFGATGLTSSPSADAILANLQRETEQRLADQNWFANRDAATVRGAASKAAGPNLLDYGHSILGGMSGISRQMSRGAPGFSLLEASASSLRRSRK